ncbi:unnamed protein product [Acanthoscelides obtectus]|uniref:Regulatory protein zeste n=1 Tax=Acanthoscelides obtectus TaxID=200917 RepID=A0A9P0M8A4_ACAOB|nr:unnamed protein product [Acanthoscelides obtectus]CAK1650452.1 hypothetical protein AOBTE_LOCUS16777 [Acanthoscelides obtectus]
MTKKVEINPFGVFLLHKNIGTCYSIFAKKNREVISNKFNGPDGKAKGHELWQNSTHQLNSLGFGVKNKEDWRRALIDWKCKTKAKASKIKQEIVKTGGGPANYVPLSDAEKRLLSLMGTKSVQGDDVCEMGFGQVTTTSNTTDIFNSTMEASSCNVINQENRQNYNIKILPDHNYTPTNTKTPSRKHQRTAYQRTYQRNSNRLTTITEESLQVLKKNRK